MWGFEIASDGTPVAVEVPTPYEQGHLAFFEDKDLSENPHIRDDYRAEWEDGWHAARAEQRWRRKRK